MYVLFRRGSFEPWYLDSVHVHLADVIKERDRDKFGESQIELWTVRGDKVLRDIIHPTDYSITTSGNLV